MEVIKAFAIQTPLILASLLLVIAALLKMGKEKGALPVFLGTIGLFLLTVANPIIYSVIMPRIVESTQPENLHTTYQVMGIVTNIAWAISIVLIAIGTISRSTAQGQNTIQQG